MGGIFVHAAIDHFRQFPKIKGMLADRGWPFPGPLLVAGSLFQLLAGLGLGLGVLRPWVVLGAGGLHRAGEPHAP